ncbi:hypothetical protein [Streptomyces sp. NPDC048277]|uniref:hypothetical protein n=1 Tax=Streptomyces sp. NPDC048277 TaxID=3155027 RepID=UPI0033E08ED1
MDEPREELRDAQIKLSSVATDPFGLSGRAMTEALIAGERNPRTLANLARGRLTTQHDALVEALTGQFDDHHARLLRLLLTTVDHLTAQITVLDQDIATTLADLPHPGTTRRTTRRHPLLCRSVTACWPAWTRSPASARPPRGSSWQRPAPT